MPASSHDHRSRVGAQRRQRMRMRLLESALVVFAQKGVGASVVPDVVAAAEVSQGTFYNYFRTNEELFQALVTDLNRDIITMIEATVSGIEDDPLLQIAIGVRSYLHIMRSHGLVAQFVAEAGLRLVNRNSAFYDNLPRHVKAAQKRGQLDTHPVESAIDIVVGTGLLAVHRMVSGKTPRNYPERMVGMILRALGASADEVSRLNAFALPRLDVPPDSLLARANARTDATTTTALQQPAPR